MRFLTDIIRRTDKVPPRAQVAAFPGPPPVEAAPRRKAHGQHAAPDHTDETPVFSKLYKSRRPDFTPPDGSVSNLNELLDKWAAQDAKTAQVAAKPTRPARVKTRLLGFEHSTDNDLDTAPIAVPEDMTAPNASATTTATAPLFPVGWLVVTDGPGRGESFTLGAGLSQIGRGRDQTVCLDFGDEAISRSNHAAVVYDTASHTFLMGHGGKANIVRLNGKPVISTETLSHGDTISLGDTVLQLVIFATPQQNWDTVPAEPETQMRHAASA